MQGSWSDKEKVCPTYWMWRKVRGLQGHLIWDLQGGSRARHRPVFPQLRRASGRSGEALVTHLASCLSSIKGV